MIRVLVVDDSAFVRQALVRMLGSAPDIEIVGTAVDGGPLKVINGSVGGPGVWRLLNGAWFNMTSVVSTTRASVLSTQATPPPFANPPRTPEVANASLTGAPAELECGAFSQHWARRRAFKEPPVSDETHDKPETKPAADAEVLEDA